MSQISIDEDQLKDVLKKALVEVIEQKKDLLYGIVVEVFEDIALANAIKEGESSESISKKEVYNILES